MWRDQDRFPVSTYGPADRISAADDYETTEEALRPFGLRFVAYSPGRPRFTRSEVSLCPERQVGVVEGRLASEVMPMAATMTSFESDGKDVLKVDWAKDDN